MSRRRRQSVGIGGGAVAGGASGELETEEEPSVDAG
jgi:hypothetical protein